MIPNTDPTISGAVAGQAVNDTATIQPFAAIVFTDPDADALLSITIQLDSAAKGAFTAASLSAAGFSTGDGGQSYTHVAGSPAAIQAATRALVYQPTKNHVAPGATETTTFTIAISDGIGSIAANNTTTVVAASVNDTPAFVGAVTSLGAVQNGGAIDLKNVLYVIDADVGQTLTWSMASAPSYGTLVISAATQASGGGHISPGGIITYRPAIGYAGVDTFTMQVSDGVSSVTRTITVNTAPAAPYALDLAPGSDSGSLSTDNVTNAGTLSFSGSSANGDSSSTVRVFVDRNNNGVYDAGEATGTAIVNNGSWSVGGIGVSGYGDGRYKVYAEVASSSGGLRSGVSAGLDVTLDRTAPIMVITSNTSTLKAGQTATITFTFSEDPGDSFSWNGSAGDVWVEGGTLGALSGSGATRTATFTPALNTNNGVATILVGAGAYTDIAGNNGGAGAPPSLTFDTRAPAVTSIVRAGSTPTNATSVAYTVTFNENVSGVDKDDFELTRSGSAIGAVSAVSGSGATYTVVVDGISGVGTLVLDLKASGTGIVDASGNGAAGFSSGEYYEFDRWVPTVNSVTVPASATYAAGDPLQFTVNFSEAVLLDTSGGTPSLAVTLDTGGTVRANYVSGSGSASLTFRYTVVEGNIDANGVSLGANIALNGATLRDTAGNDAATTLNGVGSLAGVLVSAPAAPTVSAIELVGAALTNASSVEYFVTFSDRVTGVDIDDFTLAGSGVTGAVAAVRDSGDGIGYIVVVDNVSGDGTLRLDLNAAGTGIVGSGGGGQPIACGYSAGPVYTFDHSAPLLAHAITISDTALRIGDSATVTFSFSEAVADFGVADVTAPGAVLTDLVTSDGGRTWSATLNPAAGASSAANHLTLDYAGIRDLAGNAGAGSATSIDYAVDAVRPLLAEPIAISDPVLAIGGSATVTFTFTEAVFGLSLADIDVPNGVLTDLATLDNITWTATLRPEAGASSKGKVLTLDYTGIHDLAGNPGAGSATSGGYQVDTVRPALAASIAISDTHLTAGDRATVTFVFTEAVTDFTAADVTVANGALSNLASSDGGISWSATLTPAAGVASQANVLTLDLAGIADLAGNHGAGAVDSVNYAIDTTLAPPSPPKPPKNVIDGVPVKVAPVTLPGGVAGTSISVPIVSATGADGVADIPLATSGGASLLLAQLPVGYGLSSSGANVSVAAGLELLIATIKSATPHHGGADQQHLTGDGQDFLAGLARGGALLVQTVAPVSVAPVSGALTLTGPTGANSAGQDVALVIDAGGLAKGSTIALNGIDFAAIIGSATVVAAGGMVLSGDAAAQHITVAAGDAGMVFAGAGMVFAGAGADTLGFGLAAATASAASEERAMVLPSLTVLHGGQDADTALFAGARGSYDIEQHNGYLMVASKAAPGAKAMLVNVEQLQFADGSFAVQNSAAMDILAGMYQTVLGRQADVKGIAFWADRHQDGISLGRIALDMIGSSERSAGHAGFDGTADHDLGLLYSALFDRAADAQGLAFWKAALAGGVSIEEVATHFVESAEMVGHQRAASDWNFFV